MHAKETAKLAIAAYERTGSFKRAAFESGTHPCTVRKWVNSYAIFGESLFTDNPIPLEWKK